MKQALLILTLIICAPFAAFCGTEDVGTTSANYLKIPPFARAAALGEAFTSLSDGTASLYYNPAGITSVMGYELSFSHISWFQNINYEYLALVAPFPWSEEDKIGFSFSWFQIDSMYKTIELPSYDYTDINSPSMNFSDYKLYKFSPYDFSVSLSYGKSFYEHYSAGAVIRFTSQNIDKSNGSNISADIGAMYNNMFNGHNIRLGIVAGHLGSEIKLENTGFPLPFIFKAGLSDRFELFNNPLLIAAQAVIHGDYDSVYSLGFEYVLYDIFSLRAGLKTGGFDQPTFGLGVRHSGFEFDYAFVRYDELGPTHRFSLLYSWGTPAVALAVAPGIFSPNNDKFLDTTVFTPAIKQKDKARSAEIVISDSFGAVVRVIKADPAAVRVPWNGAGDTGTVLPDGIYTAVLKCRYDSGESVSQPVSVEIDNTPPRMRAGAEPQFLRPGADDALLIPSTFTLFSSDRNGVARWQLMIYDNNRKLFYSTTGQSQPPVSLIWDGKGNAGEYVETGEIYYYILQSTDRLGNTAQTPPKAQVILLKEIKLTFASDALFDLGKADVKISAYSILKEMKKVIDKHKDSDILVAGYTDNLQPSGGKYRNNKELSKARADAVKFFMINLLDYEAKRIKTEGFGEENPIAPNDTKEGRLKNRRVEILIQSTIYK